MVEATATTLTLSWPAPVANGEPITNYNLELTSGGGQGQGQAAVVASATTAGARKSTLTGLRPDTGYSARVRAVNCVGAGPWGPSGGGVPVQTRPLPPAPPRCECINANHNSLKLKWGEGPGKNNAAHNLAELYHYTLEMENSRNQ